LPRQNGARQQPFRGLHIDAPDRLTLRHLTVYDLMTEDLILGSAVAAVVSGKAKADQPFSPIALAERLVGEMHARVADKLKRIVLNFRTAMHADQQFSTGKVKTIDTIALALAHRELLPSEGGAA
jgi:hypothetical protein